MAGGAQHLGGAQRRLAELRAREVLAAAAVGLSADAGAFQRAHRVDLRGRA